MAFATNSVPHYLKWNCKKKSKKKAKILTYSKAELIRNIGLKKIDSDRVIHARMPRKAETKTKKNKPVLDF